MKTDSMNAIWIDFNEFGNTTYCMPNWPLYMEFCKALDKNHSIANGLRFSFENAQTFERMMKRAIETCTLFQIKTEKGWKKLFSEYEIQITKQVREL